MKIELLLNNSSNLKFTFLIEGISNTLIKELKNIEIIQTTLHSLDALKKEYAMSTLDSLRASKYIVTSDKKEENEKNIIALEKLRVSLQANENNSNTILKLIPETYKRNINCKINLKELKNSISLKEIDSSTKEEKELARLLYKSFPKEQRNLLEDGEE